MREGGAGRGAYGLVGEHAVAEPRIGLDPSGIRQGAGGDAEQALDAVVEQARAGVCSELARTGRQLRRVCRVPRERPVEAIGDQVAVSIASMVRVTTLWRNGGRAREART